MTPRSNPVYRALAAELDGRGIPHDLVRGKHHKLRFVAGGMAHSLVVPCSPSDRRSAANARAFLRRLLRAEAAA